MAILTEKLGLIKPEIDDMITPTIFADNFDKIDSEFGKKGNFFTYDESSSKLQLRSGGETGIILSEVEISGGNSGGSGNGKSIILPPNPVVNVTADTGTMTLTWIKPDSEVEIKKYNIYISETQPSTLSDMTLQGSTTELTYVLEGLENGKTYYIAVRAVSIYNYENASILNVKNGTSKVAFVCLGENNGIYRSINSDSWTAMSGLPTGTYYRQITYGNGKFVCVGDKGKSYYSTDGLTWTAMSGLNSNERYNGVVCEN